jgi:GT2 family glycosyltransferase
MKVSSVILFFRNSDDEILACINSIERAIKNVSQHDLHHEFILGFSDTQISPQVEQIILHKKIKYQSFPSNVYHSVGINKLVNHSSSDYLFVLNPDTVVSPDLFLEFLSQESQKDDDVVVIECRQIPFDHPKSYCAKTGEVTWVSGACFFIKTSAFKLVSGFNGSVFPMYCNDVDLSLRLRSKGFKLTYSPLLRVFHKKLIVENDSILRSDYEKKESLKSYLLMHIFYGVTNEFFKTTFNTQQSIYLDEDFISRVRLCKDRKRTKVPLHLLDEFFINGDFGSRRF